MKYLIAITLTLTFGQAPAFARSGDECTPAKLTFERMNRPMFIGPKATPADVAAYEKTKDSATEALHQFVIQSVSSELQRVPNRDVVTAIVNWIRCVQSGIPQYGRSADWSNLPVAYSLPGAVPRILLAYSIDRGYEAISQVTYFVEVYSFDNGTWRLVAGEAPHEFDASALNVSHVKATDSDKQWLLLTGRTYGDTQGRLHIELLSFNGRAFEELWSEVRPRTALVRVLTDAVVLTTEETDNNGHNAHEVTSTFRIEKHGLKGTS